MRTSPTAYRLALFFAVGAIAGIIIAPGLSIDMRRGVLVAIVSVAVVFLMLILLEGQRAHRVQRRRFKQLPSGDMTEAEEFIKLASSNEILSPYEAREWLDDFLIRQQACSRNHESNKG